MAITYPAILLLTVRLCAAANNICPENSINSTQSAFGTIKDMYVQQGVWHQIPCPPFSSGEAISGVTWDKIDSPATRLITHRLNAESLPIVYAESARYTFGKSGFSLVIKGVEESDGGSYRCTVIPRDTADRNAKVDIKVIGDTFPGGSCQVSSTARLQRGRRQTLPCECASQTPDVVYWSTGEGVTSDTQIIGARFCDGTTLQIQHGADYSIGSDASLTVNSLHDVQDTQRFWCHVFQSNGTLRNCRTNSQISDELRSESNALKASERFFYLRKDTQQILPCLSWTPGDTACEVEWSKLDNRHRKVLSYNLSTDVVDSSPEFNPASNFGLVIQSVSDDHAGVYRCDVGKIIQIDVAVRVIGDRFPLDGGNATEGDSVILETGVSLPCPALSYISWTTDATLFWSYGSLNAQTTVVIGTLNLPDGLKTMSDLRNNSCLSISMEGTLLLNNCAQEGDVRYWCHVFPYDGFLIRSYVDLPLKIPSDTPDSVNAIMWALPLGCIIILLVIACVTFGLRRRQVICNNSKNNESTPPVKAGKDVDELETFVSPQDEEPLNKDVASNDNSTCKLTITSNDGTQSCTASTSSHD